MAKICDMDCFNCKFPDCINDKVQPVKRYCDMTAEQKARISENKKRYYREALAKGLCGRCKHRPCYNGKSYCYECFLYYKKHNKVANPKRDYWRENGLCYFCGKPAAPGKKVCEKHLEMCRKNAATAAASRSKTNHPWVADERVRRAKTAENRREVIR